MAPATALDASRAAGKASAGFFVVASAGVANPLAPAKNATATRRQQTADRIPVGCDVAPCARRNPPPTGMAREDSRTPETAAVTAAATGLGRRDGQPALVGSRSAGLT